LSFSFCSSPHDTMTRAKTADSISRIEMNLSAFGLESDDSPSIDCVIDFAGDSSRCSKSYYNPAYKPSTYRLTSAEMKKVLELFQTSALEKLKTEYTVSKTDQATSTTTIYVGQRKFVIKDYGLEGEFPLKELYKIVYKF
jgi:hypothetical protein